MKRVHRLALGIALALAASGSAQAALVDRGGGLIYDDVLDVTWLQDANYAQTSGYDIDGLMSWDDAVAWASNLAYVDSVSGLTLTGWRLPTVSPVNGSTFNYSFLYDGSSDLGYNISAPGSAYSGATGSELAYMYYNNLDNLGYFDVSGPPGPQAGWSSTPNASFTDGETGATVSFRNLESFVYWSGTEYGPNPSDAWYFGTDLGSQNYNNKGTVRYAWAVRPGDVADDRPVVPLPLGLPLLLVGLTGYALLGRRRR